jgi:D-aminopeptidase
MNSGPLDAITDVAGVGVGHAQEGLTALVPYPRSVKRRKVWGAFRGEGRIGQVSGLHVLRDFGTLSSPILFCPLGWFGAVYDALIEDGFARDPDLSIDAGWPPIVFGLPPAAPSSLSAPPSTARIRSMLDGAAARVAMGADGAMGPLAIPGAVAGIGTCSRMTRSGQLVGALAACTASVRIVIVATEAPLGPLALGRLAERALHGIEAAGVSHEGASPDGADDPLPPEGIAALAFTSAQGVEGAFEARNESVSRTEAPPAERAELGRAAAAAARQAARSALG